MFLRQFSNINQTKVVEVVLAVMLLVTAIFGDQSSARYFHCHWEFFWRLQKKDKILFVSEAGDFSVVFYYFFWHKYQQRIVGIALSLKERVYSYFHFTQSFSALLISVSSYIILASDHIQLHTSLLPCSFSCQHFPYRAPSSDFIFSPSSLTSI